MQLYQYQTQSAPLSTTSFEERSRPPVPRFSESTGDIRQHSDTVVSPGTIMEDLCFPDGFSLGPALSQPFFGDEHFGDYQAPFAGRSMEHSSSTESQTISPADMHHVSPESALLTYQSTPRTPFLDNSPYGQVCYSNDPSPACLFSDSPALEGGLDFNQNVDTANFFQPLEVFAPGKEEITVSEPAKKESVSMSRKGSSPGKGSPSSRLSLSSGITKKKKRSSRPLPEIEVDLNDPADIKKRRNTLAARKSRNKKEEQKEALMELCAIWKHQAYARGYRPNDEQEEERLEKTAGLRL
ncbi:MAG: hypothetical protein Q9207_001625 [Kuettlingeria erythrocarpa]